MEEEKKVASVGKIVPNMHKCHKVVLENRNTLSVTGIDKVDNVSPTHFSCVTMNTEMHVEGQDMQVIKLDVEQGVVEISGQIDSIKYSGEKKSIIKRLFK